MQRDDEVDASPAPRWERINRYIAPDGTLLPKPIFDPGMVELSQWLDLASKDALLIGLVLVLPLFIVDVIVAAYIRDYVGLDLISMVHPLLQSIWLISRGIAFGLLWAYYCYHCHEVSWWQDTRSELANPAPLHGMPPPTPAFDVPDGPAHSPQPGPVVRCPVCSWNIHGCLCEIKRTIPLVRALATAARVDRFSGEFNNLIVNQFDAHVARAVRHNGRGVLPYIQSL